MVFFIAVLTFILVVICAVLILLVLMQLPKKDAGAGVAFGGAATDALFGAGSGNFLTKATKYACGIFFVLAITLAVLQSKVYHRGSTEFRRQLEGQGQTAPGATPQAAPVAPLGAPEAAPLQIPPAGAPAAGGTNPNPAPGEQP